MDETTAPAPQLDIVVPVHNEERGLETSVRRLTTYLRDEIPFTYRITIADNASQDATWSVATLLATELPEVRAVRLSAKGRGRALHQVWSESEATVLAYMDVDLSTDLTALFPLVAPLFSGHSDVAIGTRLAHASNIVRGPRRELVSRSYNLLLRATLGVTFTDAQCGFKAIRASVAHAVLPLVEDRTWFFDTELLVLCERAGLRIHEVPVDWVDDLDSRVAIVHTAVDDLRGVARLALGLTLGRIPFAEAFRGHQLREPCRPAPIAQFLRFCAIGALSTLTYALLYLLTRTVLPPQAANVVALLVTALANTAANRRVSFGVRGRNELLRHQTRGLVAFGIGLAVTSSSLAALHAVEPDGDRYVELTVLVAANVVATVVRFLLYRGWVFGRRPTERTEPYGNGKEEQERETLSARSTS